MSAARERPGRPAPADENIRTRMREQKRAHTAPELALRRLLHSRGLRYRVDAALPLTGVRRRADVLFTGAKVAVFVDGCYWHVCPVHSTRPKNNSQWWQEKFDRNVQRDRDTDERLRAVGWTPIRVWEHEQPAEAALRIEEMVRSRAGQTTPG